MPGRGLRHLKTAGVGLAGLALGLLVGSRVLRPSVAGPYVPPSPPAGAEPYLDRVMPDLDLVAVPFEEAVEKVRRLTGAPLSIHRRALEAAGIDLRAPVTFHARDVTVEQAVTGLSDVISTANARVGCAADGGAIVISSGDDLNARPVVRVYDVRDLLAEGAGDPRTPPPAADGAPVGAEDLIRLIQDLVASDSWKSQGGRVAAAQYLAGRLVILQTPENHRETARLLGQLRRPPPLESPGPDVRAWDGRTRSYVAARPQPGETALRRRLTEFRCDAVPLERALAQLGESAGANLVPVWLELEQAGVARDAPVTLHLRDVTLADALRGLLDAASGSGGVLAFTPVGNHVEITYPGSQRLIITRVYDVRDGIAAAAGPPPPPDRRADRVAWEARREAEIERLTRGLFHLMEGNSGIREWNGRLIITQPWEVQEKIASLLDALGTRPVRSGAAPAGGPAATRPGRE